MKIPKNFKLFANTINVVFDTPSLQAQSILGESNLCGSEISIATSYKGDHVTEDVINDTFYHEKVHMILDTMREYELSQNEKFVDVFSKLLRQADETAQYE